MDGWSTQDIEYDSMGRAYRVSNPYFSNGYSSSVNPGGYWTTSTFDHLGRTTQVTMPRGDNNNQLMTSVQSDYSGAYTTVTDQMGKRRRQRYGYNSQDRSPSQCPLSRPRRAMSSATK